MSSSYAPGESIDITTSTDQLADEIGLTVENIAWRKDFLDFDAEDAQRLSEMAPVIEARREPLIDAFLEPIYAHDRTQEILSRSPRGDKELRMIVDGYLQSLTGGQYDRSYFEHRTRIGQLHDRLDMPMYYFVGMFANLHDIVLGELRTLTVDALADAVEDDETREAVVSQLDETFANAMAAIRMTNLDLQVITDTYLHSYSQGMREEIEASKRMREEIGETVVSLRRTAEEVEQSAQEVDTLAGEQSESTEEIAGEISNLSAMVEEVAASATQVEQRSADSQRLAEDGAESAEDAITVMRELDQAQRDIAAEFEALQAALDEIDEVVEVINGIADQTNLLALNASIEAARAGEAGAGFAVVADEVKSLAEESKVKVGEIEDLTERIKSNTDETASSLETGNEHMESGIDRVEDAMENLEAIVTSIRETTDGIEEVAAATDEQASSTEEVAGMVDENSRRANEIADEIDRITQGIEDQSRTASEIDESLSALETEATVRSQ